MYICGAQHTQTRSPSLSLTHTHSHLQGVRKEENWLPALQYKNAKTGILTHAKTGILKHYDYNTLAIK